MRTSRITTKKVPIVITKLALKGEGEAEAEVAES